MRSISIPAEIYEHNQQNKVIQARIDTLRKNIAHISSEVPEISIVIPAYNEEKTILKTLSSLAATSCTRPLEIVVVNNNSADKTEEIVKATGVHCIKEFKQGIAHARNAGLHFCKGTYVLEADADTIYPANWIEEMVRPLVEDKSIAVTYSTFSFIPTAATGRKTYFFYEYLADISRFISRHLKDESVNVYGFSMAFRREQGVAVDGFNFPKGAGEDGWFALKLREGGFGKLHFVPRHKTIAWTTDRRIQIDGGLWKGMIKRIKRVITRK